MTPPANPDWPHRSFRAMGGSVDLWLDVDDRAAAESAFDGIEELFWDVEAALSRFKPDSELSQLNRRSGERVRVSKLLWRVLDVSLRFAERTGGLFDPTVQRALRAAGYDETFERVQGRQQPGRMGAAQPGCWQAVERFAEDRSVRLPAGVELDFGGIGKGYTAAWAATLLGLDGAALVDAAGDIAAGEAPRGLPGWPVGIQPPALLLGNDGLPTAFVWLRRAGLATSGVDVRRWQQGSEPAHHIIDPRRGRPAQAACLTATVLAPTLTEAEVLATVALFEPAGVGGEAALLLHHSDGRVQMNTAMAQQVVWRNPTADVQVADLRREAVWQQ